MIRNLLIITGVGFILAVVGIGGAAALGGRDLAGPGWTWVVTDDEAGDESFRIERGEVSPQTTRTIEWTGADTLAIDLPADVTYVQGSEAGISITGPSTVVDRVRFTDGRLTLLNGEDGDRAYIRWSRTGIQGWSETEALKITVTAPSVTTFDVAGSSELSVRAYDQPALNLTLSGSSDVDVQGRTQTVTLDISGDGDADLEAVAMTDATVTVSGNGDAHLGPTGQATVDLSGNGDVTLTRRPARLEQTISGNGSLNQD